MFTKTAIALMRREDKHVTYCGRHFEEIQNVEAHQRQCLDCRAYSCIYNLGN